MNRSQINKNEVLPEMQFSSQIRQNFARAGRVLFLAWILSASLMGFAATEAPLKKGVEAARPDQTSESVSSKIPDELKGVGITEHLGDQVFIQDYKFKDESGREVQLSDYFQKGRPVLLNFVYYGCHNLCNFLLNGVTKTLKELSREPDWVPGTQFEVVTLSIDAHETSEHAARAKKGYLEKYGHPAAEAGWHFLTGDEKQIRELTSQVGFGYRWDEKEQQYAHSAAIFALTPDGKISRYLYGIEFRPQDLKLALLEASNGKIGTVVERFLLFCYRYDPKTRKYSVYLTKLMQAGCGGTILVFGGYLAVFWRRQRKGA